MTLSSKHEASRPNPALKPLSFLIGEWTTVGTHGLVPGTTYHGRTSFAWLEGGAFLIMYSEIDEPDIPSGIAIFGSDDALGEYFMLYFDERGVSRRHDVSLHDNVLQWWRNAPGFSQRNTLTIEDDGQTIIGKGELPVVGQNPSGSGKIGTSSAMGPDSYDRACAARFLLRSPSRLPWIGGHASYHAPGLNSYVRAYCIRPICNPMTTLTNQLIVIPPAASPDHATRREFAIAAWLAEKAELSQSKETQRAYGAIMGRFRQALHLVDLDLDAAADTIKPIAQAFAAAGRVKASTHNRRLAIISSFYTYAIEGGLLAPPNPIDKVRRRRVQPYRAARALDADVVKRGLAAIDRKTLAGARDYALISVAVVTGRRVSELAGLRFGDLEPTESERVRVTWQRTKGDETYTDLLPKKVSAALLDYLGQVYDAWEDDPPPAGAAVWVSTSNHHRGGPITSQAIADICARHLKTSKVHRLRQTFAWTMEQHGAKISEIQRKLGHKSIATTSLYLQALTNEENPYAEKIEGAILGESP